jgi:ribosomal protein S14
MATEPVKKPAKKSSAGRPPKYTEPSKMEVAIDDYFTQCKADDRPYTIMGLALALGMCRDTLCEYAKNGEFSDIVKNAKLKVELSVEERLFAGNPTGCIFWLKNHAGYKDKHETELTGKDGETLTFIMDFSGKTL